MNKKYFKIFATCLKESSCLTCKKDEKVLLATVTSKSNAIVCIEALSKVYKSDSFKLSIE